MLEKNHIKIPGIRVGHAQDIKAATGCTVILCEEGAVAGVDVRGGAPGTRETDLLDPVNMVDRVHGILLTGGSAFGLDAAAGVMQYLEQKDIGFDVEVTKVPIVSGAVLFDLTIGDFRVRPDKEMGYNACVNSETDNWSEGNIGAGTGATVGKLFGLGNSMKSGLGSYYIQVGDLIVGAIVAVNSFGDIVDPKNGNIIAGALAEDGKTFVNSESFMIQNYNEKNITGRNTSIGVVVTNAQMTKAQANKIASMAHDGYARTMRPAHTMVDGDTIFALATGRIPADINVVGVLAARTIEQAVLRAVKESTTLYGIKCYKDLQVI